MHVLSCRALILTFLCSEAVLGLSGVVFMLAGVAATGEEEVFSIISAGIFSYRKYPTKKTQQITVHWRRRQGDEYLQLCDIQKSPLSSQN